MRRLPPSSLVLRVLMALGPVAALACGGLDGHRPSHTTFAVAAVLSLAYAARPDAWFGTALMVGVVVWWAQALDDQVPVSVLPAMLALTLAHVAGLLADQGPARMALAREVAVLWAWRGGAVVLAAAGLWVLALLVRGTAAPGVWVTALALGTLAATGVAVLLGRTREG